MATIEDLFSHIAIDRVVSTVRDKDYRMAKFYGMQVGGSAVDRVPGRKFGWDRFDVTRLIAQGRTPGSSAAQVALNPVGTVLATAYRMNEETFIDYERIYRNRAVGRPMGEVDAQGERYIALQMQHKLRRFMAAREFMVNRMFVEGGFKLVVKGQDVIPKAFSDTTTGAVSIDFQHPAANKLGVVADLGGTAWTNAAALIINDLIDINDLAEKGSRFPLTQAWCDTEVAKSVMNNTQVQATGGTANTWFNMLGYTPTQNDQQQITPGMSFSLRGFPQITWHIYGDRFETDDSTSGTPVFINAIPAGNVILTPNPDPEWVEYREGSELVQKRENGDIEEQFGFGMWQEIRRNPLGIAMFGLDNGLPTPYVPNAWFIVDTSP